MNDKTNQNEIDDSKHRVIKAKFGTAGIRGVFGEDVSVRETIAVCFAVNELVGEGKFGLGCDSRNSSLVLSAMACSAMNWYGSDVENYGMIPTPVLAYNIKNRSLHAGFSVTASHNPSEYAGVKVFGTDGIEFSIEAEQKVEQFMEKSSDYIRREDQLLDYGSTYEICNSIELYREAIIKNASPTRRKFKILVDCANGTSAQVTPKILSELGHKVVTVNAHASSSFPGRLPEPMVETLQEVGRLAQLIGADFAVTHDGDADRLVMIDANGCVVPDYAISTLVLKIILEKVKHGSVIISYNTSDAVEFVAKEAGCTVQRSRLGKTFQELYNKKGVFACEPSKMVDPRWGYWEDGIYSSVLVVQYLSQLSLTLTEALLVIPKYYNFTENLSLSSQLDYGALKRKMANEFAGSLEALEDIDGVKIRLSNNQGWLMLRSSGTENKIRVYSESSDEKEARWLLEKGVMIASSSQAK